MQISQSDTQLEPDEIDLFALTSTLWRGKLWIILSAIVLTFVGGLYAFKFATPLYPSTAVVALETKKQQVLDIESVLSGGAGGSEEVNTEVEVIRSRNLIYSLVEKLNLIEDPEFNEELVKPSKYNPVVFLQEVFGIELEQKTDIQIINKVIDNVIDIISVSNIRKSLVFSISVTTENADKSALIANTLSELYIQNSLSEKLKATTKASEWLSKKAAELKVELEQSEIEMKAFSDSIQLINAEVLAGRSIQLKEMRGRITELEKQASDLDSHIILFESAIKKSTSMQSISDSSKDLGLERILNDVESGQISEEEFKLRAQSVLQKMKREITRIKNQTQSLQISETKFKDDIDKQSEDLVKLQQLERVAAANGLLYESFLSRLKETAVQIGLQQADSRLLSAAVPRKAASPKKGVILVLFMMLGLVLGAALVLLEEFRNNTFRINEDLETYTGYSVLGSIPALPKSSRKDVLSYAKLKPTSVFAEAIRNLRTSVLLSNPDSAPQVIMSTSSVPGEGKTTMSLSLAQNMAGLNKRILVIEGDIRKRIFADYFDISNQAGFMSFMAGDIEFDQAIFKSKDLGFDIMIAEKSNINAVDVFSSMKFADLINNVRKSYDYIIIDTAPVLAVPDARVVAKHVDAIIYSVLWDKTEKSEVKQGLSMFESVGIRINGLVLNNIDAKKMSRYGYKTQSEYGDGYHDN